MLQCGNTVAVSTEKHHNVNQVDSFEKEQYVLTVNNMSSVTS